MTETQAASAIRFISVVFFVTALIFASGAFASIDGASILLHDFLDWPPDGATAEYTREARWFSAIGGGVFAGLCALFYFVVAPLVAEGDLRARRGVIIAMLTWFVIDSAGSIAAGVASNAVFNVLFLFMIIGPVLAIRPAEARA